METKILGKDYKHGNLIIKKGTSGNCLYIIQQGTIKVIDEKWQRNKNCGIEGS